MRQTIFDRPFDPPAGKWVLSVSPGVRQGAPRGHAPPPQDDATTALRQVSDLGKPLRGEQASRADPGQDRGRNRCAGRRSPPQRPQRSRAGQARFHRAPRPSWPASVVVDRPTRPLSWWLAFDVRLIGWIACLAAGANAAVTALGTPARKEMAYLLPVGKQLVRGRRICPTGDTPLSSRDGAEPPHGRRRARAPETARARTPAGRAPTGDAPARRELSYSTAALSRHCRCAVKSPAGQSSCTTRRRTARRCGPAGRGATGSERAARCGTVR